MSKRYRVTENFVDDRTGVEEIRVVGVFRLKGDALHFMTHNTLYPDDALEMSEVDATPEYTLYEGYTVTDDKLQNLLHAIFENGIENFSMLRTYMSSDGDYYGINSFKELRDIVQPNLSMIKLALDGQRYEQKRQMDGNTTY